MKKYLAAICAAMMCVCCLALAACGGSGSSSSSAAASESSSTAAADSSSAAAADSSSATSAEANVAGDWQLAAMDYQGILISGDFSIALGTSEKITMSLKSDGTGSMAMAGDSAELTWTSDASGNITIIPTNGNAESVSGTIDNGAIILDFDDEGTMIFTQDGTYAGAKEIKISDAQKITSESQLEGSWKVAGFNMNGMSGYGEPAQVAEALNLTDTSLSFDGKGGVTVMGESGTYTVDATDGAVITDSGLEIPVLAYGDDIAIDASKLVGIDLIIVFSK